MLETRVRGAHGRVVAAHDHILGAHGRVLGALRRILSPHLALLLLWLHHLGLSPSHRCPFENLRSPCISISRLVFLPKFEFLRSVLPEKSEIISMVLSTKRIVCFR